MTQPAYNTIGQSYSHWRRADTRIVDALVGLLGLPVRSTLADTVWKGKRDSRLEEVIIARLAALTGEEAWAVYQGLDDLQTELAQDAGLRLGIQEG